VFKLLIQARVKVAAIKIDFVVGAMVKRVNQKDIRFFREHGNEHQEYEGFEKMIVGGKVFDIKSSICGLTKRKRDTYGIS